MLTFQKGSSQICFFILTQLLFAFFKAQCVSLPIYLKQQNNMNKGTRKRVKTGKLFY